MIMKSKKKWYERYNYGLMDQQFKVEIERNPNFNIEENIKDLKSLLLVEMGNYWVGFDIFCHERYLYYNRTIRYWKRYKKENENHNTNSKVIIMK